MFIECERPDCDGTASLGINYQQIIDLAEGGKLTCMCVRCGHSWRPSASEQKLIATNVRQYVADNHL